MRRLLVLCAAVGGALALAPAAFAAVPAPFGHACAPQHGVRFCPTTGLSERVPSFDGVPLDVDVTLPARGNGPFPTILLLHGLGGTKADFEGPGGDPHYNSVFFARHGYAVVTPTARGFGNSCGIPASRTAGCARGWTHLGDMRFEVRDVQHLVGLLVDEGVTRPDAIASTGISYGGGTSMMLAYLRNRVRLPGGGLRPWRSPKGTPIAITAAWPRWLWSNGASIFTRNGRGAWRQRPIGVEAQAYAGGIFAVPFAVGFVAPVGADPTADLMRWKQLLDAGRFGSRARAVLDNAYAEHGVAQLRGRPSPLLLQSGWTDALFPVSQSLAAYRALRRAHPDAPIALQLGDLGHAPGANHPRDTARFDRQGLRFIDAWLRRHGSPPKPGRATAFTMACPQSAPSGGGPYRASAYAGLARGRLAFAAAGRLRITSAGASADLAAQLDPLTRTGGDLCTRYAPDPTSHATVRVRSPGVTLLGQPVITGRVRERGSRYGQLDARVWDLAHGRQRLITRGAYRLTRHQRGRFRFRLDGNGWRFRRGHRIVVELLGRDAPTYGASVKPFRATLRHVRVALPVRDRPSRRRGIARPR